MPARAGRRAADGAGARAALLERRKPFFTGLARFGVGKALYLQDPFHTLLNLPWWKFIIIFFSTYVLQFCTFALVYLAFPNTCTHGIDGNFGHALWMSSRTASTIGFNQVRLGVCVVPCGVACGVVCRKAWRASACSAVLC
jgi:hypothetical protein